MTDQPTLFDKREAARRRNEAMEAVESTSDAVVWAALAMPVLHSIAEQRFEFTTDRLEYELTRRNIPRPPEPRALGPLMKRAAKLRWIEATDRTVKSVMPANHRRPKAVWRSLIYRGRDVR